MRTARLLLPFLAVGCVSAGAPAPPAGAPGGPPRDGAEDATWTEAIEGLERREGLMPFYLDRDGHRVLLEVAAPDAAGRIGSYLYVEGIATGLGSNPVGLDRGQLGGERLLDLRRLGRRVLFEQPNLGYRALTADADELRATRESFATSVVWAADAVALHADGRALIDLTPFLLRDAHGVVRTLAETEQGSFQLDASRSAVDFDACLAFPDNVELEALLTFSGEDPGEHVRSTAPDPRSITLVQHHSLIRLPAPGYEPRELDPRMGSFGIGFADYAAPLDQPIERRWIARHRLSRTDPEAPSSPAVEPLVYYVDRGAPEPVRSALLEGASWWARAFEAAGFEDAFRVELLPEGVHPLDVRYNVIQWVHRSTRGWSYGGGVTDPRTGEIIKGHVSLGSLRVRQDRLIFEGLAGVGATGSGRADDPVELALARIRQLSAHEVGHTLGFAHNFAASTYGGRASVMDYPAPLVGLDENGELDLSSVYATGIGSWDEVTTDWAYRQFPAWTDERAGLEEIVERALADGHRYLTDADARPPGAAQPLANLWDNGADPVEELGLVMAVRAAALARFGRDNLAAGRPLALLEEVLAPLYFHHRYQVDATVKMVGGLDYVYAVQGDGQPGPRPVAPEAQRAALSALLTTLDPAALDLPEEVLGLLAPRPSGYGPNRELFAGATAPAFDPVAAAVTAADLTVSGLLQAERLGRTADFHRRDGSFPAPDEVLATLVEQALASASDPRPRRAHLGRAVGELVARRLAELARAASAPGSARAAAAEALRTLREELGAASWGDDEGWRAQLVAEIERFEERPWTAELAPAAALPPPPGSPIGQAPETPPGCSLDFGELR